MRLSVSEKIGFLKIVKLFFYGLTLVYLYTKAGGHSARVAVPEPRNNTRTLCTC